MAATLLVVDILSNDLPIFELESFLAENLVRIGKSIEDEPEIY